MVDLLLFTGTVVEVWDEVWDEVWRFGEALVRSVTREADVHPTLAV